MIKEGDNVFVKVKAVVRKVYNSHGECYHVELPQRDYAERRKVWVDIDEIEELEELIDEGN